MQDRGRDTQALIRREERRAKAELAGAATAQAAIEATRYIRRGFVDLVTMAGYAGVVVGVAGVEGTRVAGSSVWHFSRGFLGRVRSRGSERLQ